ncbi:MAG: hypothetical protein JW913_12425 [Chitinispirillaceae bacterium]|nr:hypothetical protein [Chitinispirillaceae bacterium]
MPGLSRSSIKDRLKGKGAASSLQGSVEKRAEAIPKKAVLSPNMPVGTYLQEAYNIHCFMRDDRELFTGGGFDWRLVDELPERIGYLRNAEAAWWKAKFAPSPVKMEFERRQALAVEARGKLLRDLEFACRGDADALRRIREIKKGSGQSDFNMDLFDIGNLAQDKNAALVAIGSDPRLVDDIRECAEKLPGLYAQCHVEKAAEEEKRSRRDRAYTFLAMAMEEIRRCARYVLRDDPKRLKGYASEYFRKSSRGKSRSDAGGSEQGFPDRLQNPREVDPL